MLDKRSKEKLETLMLKRKRNIARLIYIAHRYMHEWATKKWQEDGWGELNPDHLRLLAIIGAEAVSNNELAKRARVSKQATSKMVSFLETRGYVEVQPDPNDSRAKIISVTRQGVEWVSYFNGCASELEERFVNLIGRKKVNDLIDIMSELCESLIDHDKKELNLPPK